MDRQTVVVALDAGCVERAQEDAVGAHERAGEHLHARVGLLDRGVGRTQDGGVVLGFFRAREVGFVGLVGLVPDLDRRQARAVARGEVGDEGRVRGRFAWRPGVGCG